MKKNLLLRSMFVLTAVVLSSMLLTSCDKKDEPKKTTELTGKWVLTDGDTSVPQIKELVMMYFKKMQKMPPQVTFDFVTPTEMKIDAVPYGTPLSPKEHKGLSVTYSYKENGMLALNIPQSEGAAMPLNMGQVKVSETELTTYAKYSVKEQIMLKIVLEAQNKAFLEKAAKEHIEIPKLPIVITADNLPELIDKLSKIKDGVDFLARTMVLNILTKNINENKELTIKTKFIPVK